MIHYSNFFTYLLTVLRHFNWTIQLVTLTCQNFEHGQLHNKKKKKYSNSSDLIPLFHCSMGGPELKNHQNSVRIHTLPVCTIFHKHKIKDYTRRDKLFLENAGARNLVNIAVIIQL